MSFVPKTVSFPPTSTITYIVTILDSTGEPLYSHTYDDDDGILDLDLVPAHKLPLSSPPSATNATAMAKSKAQQFTTWGPDFIG